MQVAMAEQISLQTVMNRLPDHARVPEEQRFQPKVVFDHHHPVYYDLGAAPSL